MRYFFILVFTFFLVGCSLKPEPSIPVNKYRIEVNIPLHVEKNPIKKVLKVLAPYGLRSIKSTDIIYTKGDGKYSAYRDSKWEETPSRQINLILTKFLHSSGIFSSVITSPSKIKYDLLLEAQVLGFEQVLIEKKSFIRLHVKLFLISALKKEVIGSKEFKLKEYTKTVDAKGVNEAFGVALTKINKDLNNWLLELKNAKIIY